MAVSIVLALWSLALAAHAAAATPTTSTSTSAATCSAGPIYVDFHSRVTNGGFNFQYGLFVGVGTPFQNLSLWPSFQNNETYLTSSDFCDDSKYQECVNETHGIYVPTISSSFESGSFTTLDTVDLETLSVEETGTDTLDIFTHYFDPSPPNVTYVDKFPVTVIGNFSSGSSSPWFGLTGHLGLGPSSTVLQMLYDQGAISSKSFGFYVGNSYTRAGGAVNGSLTLGGHDAGRWADPIYEFPISPVISSSDGSTPFKVTVESISLLNADNTTLGQLNESPFDAYISTSQFPLTLPDDAATSKFASLTGGMASTNPYDTSFVLPSSFLGSLSITLSTGLVVTIPNSELRNISNISPVSAIPAASNSSTADSTTTVTTPSVPVLGTSFLSHVYLIAQYSSSSSSSSSSSFHLASALPFAPYVQVQSICDNGTTTLIPSQQVSVSSFASKGIVGAIVGGVIGGIGVTFAVWYLARRYYLHKMHEEFEKSLPEEKRRVNKSKNPISAYRRKIGMIPPPPATPGYDDDRVGINKKASFSSSDEESVSQTSYEMQQQQQQAVLSPRRVQFQLQSQQESESALASASASASRSPPSTTSPSMPTAIATAMRSQAPSKTRFKFNFSPGKSISTRHQANDSGRNSNSNSNNIPPTPNTGFPLLAAEPAAPTSSTTAVVGTAAAPQQYQQLQSQSQSRNQNQNQARRHHQRSKSQDRRNQLGLVVRT